MEHLTLSSTENAMLVTIHFWSDHKDIRKKKKTKRNAFTQKNGDN